MLQNGASSFHKTLYIKRLTKTPGYSPQSEAEKLSLGAWGTLAK